MGMKINKIYYYNYNIKFFAYIESSNWNFMWEDDTGKMLGLESGMKKKYR